MNNVIVLPTILTHQQLGDKALEKLEKSTGLVVYVHKGRLTLEKRRK